MIPAGLRLPLFVVLCAAQLFVAGRIIVGSERVLVHGELYRFRTEPIDPADLVRGRYVALRFRDRQAPVVGEPVEAGQNGFAVLGVDPEGFAYVRHVQATTPREDDYLNVFVTVGRPDSAEFEFPIDRFYMPEDQAPVAEQLYAEAQREGRGTWAEIRVHAGTPQIEQLYIDGVPVGLAVQRARETTAVPQP